MKPVFDKSGLLTTVVCDARTNKVLMVAWMNEESYALTKKRTRHGFGHVLAKNFGIRAKKAEIRRKSFR